MRWIAINFQNGLAQSRKLRKYQHNFCLAPWRPLAYTALFQASVNLLGLFRGCSAVRAGLEGLERGLEGGHLGAGGDDLGGELGELGVEVGAELLDGLFEAVVGGDLFGLADLDGAEVGEDGVEEQVGEGIHGVNHEEILRGVGIGRRITGEWALVMG